MVLVSAGDCTTVRSNFVSSSTASGPWLFSGRSSHVMRAAPSGSVTIESGSGSAVASITLPRGMPSRVASPKTAARSGTPVATFGRARASTGPCSRDSTSALNTGETSPPERSAAFLKSTGRLSARRRAKRSAAPLPR